MTELKREDFQGTWFDVSGWTEEQKTQFQLKCFELGYRWFINDARVQELQASRYFLIRNCITYSTGQYYSREHEVQKQFTDMFPNYEAPKPIDVVEEIRQLFVAEMGKEDSEVGEDERGFEGLVYVEPDRGVCIPYSVLSQDQKEFLLDSLSFKTCYGHNEPNACHFSYDEGAKVWFTETRELCDRDFLISFNDLFKYEDEL
ncbi:hypothetical protein VPBG_00166 [Vibrio phage helene 12B3]|uniref:hypothetical protein n=1 Tax=Vibrio phage helene 12B3 TaxID=573173 RepID=UPI0002C059E0|nr:hypothetical protein VPBG_00166 [Vibrio phage helene 12B3]YP_009223037.1 hypothetical protein VPLG_00188 [Vibrio phage eugene 12A10]AGG57938.1 hypothetical protein VPBG_00166 [Vibrio phage helene 12B3]AGN51627.1 hypothetical protein VPLG_00188 [Vibrio phage eugene 12A10]